MTRGAQILGGAPPGGGPVPMQTEYRMGRRSVPSFWEPLKARTAALKDRWGNPYPKIPESHPEAPKCV